MPLATLRRPMEANAPANSTTTQTTAPPNPSLDLSTQTGTLRLRGEPIQRRRIRWAEDVVDNENLGRKSSKVCCIYHKPRPTDESSEDDSSSAESESDSEPDNSRARVGGKGKDKRKGDHHDHPDGDEGCSHSPSTGRARKKGRRNAYEKMPKSGTLEQKA